MVKVHARWVVAGMTDNHAFWNVTAKHLEDRPMSSFVDTLDVIPKHPVGVGWWLHSCPDPQPALIVAGYLDLGPEPLGPIYVGLKGQHSGTFR